MGGYCTQIPTCLPTCLPTSHPHLNLTFTSTRIRPLDRSLPRPAARGPASAPRIYLHPQASTPPAPAPQPLLSSRSFVRSLPRPASLATSRPILSKAGQVRHDTSVMDDVLRQRVELSRGSGPFLGKLVGAGKVCRRARIGLGGYGVGAYRERVPRCSGVLGLGRFVM